jgi:hypothetical protein
MAQSDNRHVATPFGKQPSHRVRQLGENQQVTHNHEHGDQLFHLDEEGNEIALTAHEEDTAATSTEEVPELIAWATWTNNSSEADQENCRLFGTFTVPEAPADQGDEQIFVTLALQSNDNPVMILTASLQWGQTGAGGGRYWAVACWAAIGSQVFFSDLIQVQPGDLLECEVYKETRDGNATWNSICKVGEAGTRTGVNSDRNLNIAIPCMFEAAEGASCTGYPNGMTPFEQLTVEGDGGTLTPTWTPKVYVSTCNTQVDVVDETTIRLTYQQ